MFLFVVPSPKPLKLLRTAHLTGGSGSNKHMTSSVFPLEREFGGKNWISSFEPVKHVGLDAVLDSGKSLSHWFLGGGKDHNALTILMLFLFVFITSHYQSQGHRLGRPFGLTYVKIHSLFIWDWAGNNKTRHGAVFCTSECLTVTAGAFSFRPSCLRINGFCLRKIMMSNRNSCFTYYQDDCLLFLRMRCVPSISQTSEKKTELWNFLP